MKPKMDIVSFMNCKLEGSGGSSVTASDLWHEHDAIFVFARDMECSQSRAHIKRVFENRESLTDAGAQIYLIVADKSNFSEAVGAELGIGDTPVFEDNSFVSFRAAGFNTEPCTERYQIGGIVLVKRCGAVPFHSIMNATFEKSRSSVAVA